MTVSGGASAKQTGLAGAEAPEPSSRPDGRHPLRDDLRAIATYINTDGAALDAGDTTRIAERLIRLAYALELAGLE